MKSCIYPEIKQEIQKRSKKIHVLSGISLDEKNDAPEEDVVQEKIGQRKEEKKKETAKE